MEISKNGTLQLRSAGARLAATEPIRTGRAHMMTRRTLIVGLSAAGTMPPTTLRATAIYPDRTIRLVVPFPPGNNSDIASRVVASRLQTRFGHPVIVENRPGGAGGTVGASGVARAEP